MELLLKPGVYGRFNGKPHLERSGPQAEPTDRNLMNTALTFITFSLDGKNSAIQVVDRSLCAASVIHYRA